MELYWKHLLDTPSLRSYLWSVSLLSKYLHLALTQAQQPLKLSACSAKVPAIGDPEDIDEMEIPEGVKELITAYQQFSKESNVTTGTLISPLRSLLHNACRKVSCSNTSRTLS